MLYQFVFKEAGDWDWRYAAWREEDDLEYLFETYRPVEYFIQNENLMIVFSK